MDGIVDTGHWWRTTTNIAGFDVGKRGNPSHCSVFGIRETFDEITQESSEILVMISQKFLDNWEYIRQVDYLTSLVEYFNIRKLYYDNTRGEMEERSLPRECIPIVLSNRTGPRAKGKMELATNFAKLVEQKRMILLDDDRFISQITCVTGDLQAPNTPRGHGDCYDSETEVLTKAGWKYFKDLELFDKVATLSSIGILEYQNPIRIVDEEYNGKMFHVSNQQVDLLVSPKHKLYVNRKICIVCGKPTKSFANSFCSRKCYGAAQKGKKAKNGQKYREISNFQLLRPEMIEGCDCYYKKNAIWDAEDADNFVLDASIAGKKKKRFVSIEMDSFVKFVGYYASEGYISHNKKAVIISQKSGWKSDRMFNNLKGLFGKSEYAERHSIQQKNVGKDSGIYINSVSLARWAVENIGHRSKEKRIPNFVLDLSSRQLKLLLDALVLGDGSYEEWTVGSNNNYGSISKVLCDQIQEIALKVGWSGNLSWSDRNIGRAGAFGFGKNRNYGVSFSIKRDNALVRAKCNKWENYNGRIYCCEVPNHIIYVRRNGKPVWSGNSFISIMLAVGVFYDYYASDRRMGTSSIGNVQDIVESSDKIDSSNTINVAKRDLKMERCVICGNSQFNVAPQGLKKICTKCFTIW